MINVVVDETETEKNIKTNEYVWTFLKSVYLLYFDRLHNKISFKSLEIYLSDELIMNNIMKMKSV